MLASDWGSVKAKTDVKDILIVCKDYLSGVSNQYIFPPG